LDLAFSYYLVIFNLVAIVQVKYTFNKGKAVLVMPPPYSSEIQVSNQVLIIFYSSVPSVAHATFFTGVRGWILACSNGREVWG
jgi:hypothetical protein